MNKPRHKFYLVDKITGKITKEYENVYEVKEDYSEPGLYLMAKNKTLREGRYVLRYRKDYNPREVFSKEYNTPYAIFEGDRLVYLANNSREVAKHFYCDVSAINRHAKDRTKLLKRYEVVRLLYMGMIYDLCDETGKRYGRTA